LVNFFQDSVRHKGEFIGLLKDLPVGRDNQPDIMFQVANRPWQTAGNVGKSTGLYHGVCFTTGEQDFHYTDVGFLTTQGVRNPQG
jgi:hypothetical protein